MLKNPRVKIEKSKILSKKEPEKNLLLAFKRTAGRGNSGRITVWHKGGGVKRIYRIIDFAQKKIDIPGKISALEYDPFRDAFIALVEYEGGEKLYRLAAHDLKVGDEVICSEKTELKIGNRMKLKNIPVGTQVFEVEIEPGRGGKMVRGAGSSAKVLAQEGKYVNLEMPSTEIRKVLGDCFATIGTVSNPAHKYERRGKASISRFRGIRPRVRGTVMNPCDHPHGGGEGRTPRGMKYPKTPWGKHAMGVKTRSRKFTNKFIVSRRRRKK